MVYGIALAVAALLGVASGLVADNGPGYVSPGMQKILLTNVIEMDLESKRVEASNAGGGRAGASREPVKKEPAVVAKVERPLTIPQTVDVGPGRKLVQGTFAFADKDGQSASELWAKWSKEPRSVVAIVLVRKGDDGKWHALVIDDKTQSDASNNIKTYRSDTVFFVESIPKPQEETAADGGAGDKEPSRSPSEAKP